MRCHGDWSVTVKKREHTIVDVEWDSRSEECWNLFTEKNTRLIKNIKLSTSKMNNNKKKDRRKKGKMTLHMREADEIIRRIESVISRIISKHCNEEEMQILETSTILHDKWLKNQKEFDDRHRKIHRRT